ncbi:DUF6482 family protein [Halopseudomonas sp.]|uniref:DUF6482 family protein n=1 Tax=Halopseudomonas sp. TaxID=2901191 RepID=UPI003565F24F
MTLDDLQKLAGEGQVIELNVLSHEGSIYLVEAVLDDRRYMLKKNADDKSPWTFSGLEVARNTLKNVPLETINLVHKNVYDEIGPSQEHSSEGAPEMRLTMPLRP